VEEVLLLNNFFLVLDSCENIARQSCAMVPDGDFWRLFASCILASRVQHISDMHSKFALRPHHVWKYGMTCNLRPLRLGEEKRR